MTQHPESLTDSQISPNMTVPFFIQLFVIGYSTGHNGGEFGFIHYLVIRHNITPVSLL